MLGVSGLIAARSTSLGQKWAHLGHTRRVACVFEGMYQSNYVRAIFADLSFSEIIGLSRDTYVVTRPTLTESPPPHTKLPRYCFVVFLRAVRGPQLLTGMCVCVCLCAREN